MRTNKIIKGLLFSLLFLQIQGVVLTTQIVIPTVIAGRMGTKSQKTTTAKPANVNSRGIKRVPLDNIQSEATSPTKDGNPNDGAQQQG